MRATCVALPRPLITPADISIQLDITSYDKFRAMLKTHVHDIGGRHRPLSTQPVIYPIVDHHFDLHMHPA